MLDDAPVQRWLADIERQVGGQTGFIKTLVAQLLRSLGVHDQLVSIGLSPARGCLVYGKAGIGKSFLVRKVTGALDFLNWMRQLTY